MLDLDLSLSSIMVKIEHQKSKMKRLAKIIRLITIPTNLFFAAFLLICFTNRDSFPTVFSVIIPVILIGGVVLVSYLVSFIIVKKKTNLDLRRCQRFLAFIFSFIGYLAAFIISICCKFSRLEMTFISTYFFTVCFLSIFNLFKIKASGHAAGIFGPLIYVCYFINIWYFIPCSIILFSSMWASLYLNRHTLKQFLLGFVCTTLGFILSIIIF